MDTLLLDNAFDAVKTSLNTKFTNIKAGIGDTGTHPISISGNAATATKLQNAMTLSLSGEVTGSVSFDGSGNASIATTISSLSVPAGTYNASGTSIFPFVVDSKGRITNIGQETTITPSWSNVIDKPTTVVDFGITDAAKSGINTDITSITGLTTPLSPNQGGTGLSSFVAGDLIYASNPTTLVTLPSSTSGNVLNSTGVGAIPVWGKVNLSTTVTSQLPIANGGTGALDAANARLNLGVEPGINVQAYSADLNAISALSTNGLLVRTGVGLYTTDTTVYLPMSGGTLTGALKARVSIGSIGQVTDNQHNFEVQSSAADAGAFMKFNRTDPGSAYSVYFGLDTDNKLKIGGLSLGSSSYEILHTGNFDSKLVTVTDIPNSALVNSSVSIGLTNVALGTTVSSITGLTNTGTAKVSMASASLDTITTTLATTAANQVLDSLPIAQVRSVKYLIQALSGAECHTSEVMIIHNTAAAFITVYGDSTTSGDLVTFDTDINSGNIRLLVAPNFPGTVFKIVRISVSA